MRIRIFVFLMTLVGCLRSQANTQSPELKNFDKKNCTNYKNKNLQKFEFVKENYNLPWIEIQLDGKKNTLSSKYKCQNSIVRTLSLDTSKESAGGGAIAEVRCDKGFLIESILGPLGEGRSNNYYNLSDCEQLGSGDRESVSPDKKFFVLTKDADLEAGYDSPFGLIVALDCGGEYCRQVLKKEFKNQSFDGFQWKNSTILQFNMKDRSEENEELVKFQKCTLNLGKNTGLVCK